MRETVSNRNPYTTKIEQRNKTLMLQMFLERLFYESRLLLIQSTFLRFNSYIPPHVRCLLLSIYFPPKEASLILLHCHVAVRAAVPERAALLLEGDEVPDGHHCVFRHIEVEQFHTGEGVESIQLTRRTGEIISHKKAICGEQSQIEIVLKNHFQVIKVLFTFQKQGYVTRE